jgi:hypothetical protein
MQVVRKHFAGLGRASVIVVVVAAVFAGGPGLGTGLSSTGAQTGGEIRACVNNFTGALRIANGNGQCTSSERPLSWNQQGPGGVLDVQLARASTTVETEDERNSAFVKVECPAGYRVMGGGGGRSFSVGSLPLVDWYLDASSPGIKGDNSFPDNDGWSATFGTLDGQDAVGSYGFFAEAVCVLTG